MDGEWIDTKMEGMEEREEMMEINPAGMQAVWMSVNDAGTGGRWGSEIKSHYSLLGHG